MDSIRSMRIGFLILLFSALCTSAGAQTYRDMTANGNTITSLPHELTEDEKLILDEIGSEHRSTPPPAAQPVRHAAEFEPMQGVLIRYPLGITTTVVRELADDTTVYCLVTSGYQNSAYNSFNNANVNMDNVIFFNASSDSYWTRDYGPWFIYDANKECHIVDPIYNRPRPNDDVVPTLFAGFLGINAYGPDFVTPGGNWMADGHGQAASSDLVWDENPSHTQAEIMEIINDFLGIDTYFVVPDPNNTYIDHIDCWGKFLAVDKVLIREVASNHPQYDEIEEVADYFAAQITSYGTPYQVYRVYTPNNQPYTNSLIINNKVLVPITGSSWDDDAIASYEAAMPGYDVIGCTGSWQSTDALHCRSKGVADLELLYIYSIPLSTQLGGQPYYRIAAEIDDYSDAGLISDEIQLFWRPGDSGPYTAQVMTSIAGTDSFYADIPTLAGPATVQYYIHAADLSGRSENFPYVGGDGPFSFEIETNPASTDDERPQLIQSYSCTNPIIDSGLLRFSLERAGQCDLNIFDSAGRLVRTLLREQTSSGAHQVVWDGRTNDGARANPGIYYYRLQTETDQRTQRVVLIK